MGGGGWGEGGKRGEQTFESMRFGVSDSDIRIGYPNRSIRFGESEFGGWLVHEAMGVSQSDHYCVSIMM